MTEMIEGDGIEVRQSLIEIVEAAALLVSDTLYASDKEAWAEALRASHYRLDTELKRRAAEIARLRAGLAACKGLENLAKELAAENERKVDAHNWLFVTAEHTCGARIVAEHSENPEGLARGIMKAFDDAEARIYELECRLDEIQSASQDTL